MQTKKATGMQSWLLSMVGGVEGLQRTVRDLLGGVDPITVFNELQAAFSGMGEAINATNERLDRLATVIDHADDEIAKIAADLAVVAGRPDRGTPDAIGRIADSAGAGAGAAVAVADRGGGADPGAALNGTGAGHADPSGPQHQSGGDGPADRGIV